MSVENLAAAASEMGIGGIDLLTPDEWTPLKKHGLVCTMTSGSGTIEIGLNRITQEINYPPIMRSLVDLKDDGYVAQEFFPTNSDALASLAAAVKLCDV